MAKDSDRKRGRLNVEETGGALSGLLAEEDEFDRRTLWRLGTWAVVAVGAVVVALVTNQSSIGLRREQTASADLSKQAQQLQLTARESQNETRRLASAVDTLNSDRDRLYARVAVLEQGLDSVTGAIARQAPASSSPQASSSTAKTNQNSASAAPPASSSAPPPALSPAPPSAATAAAAPAVTAAIAPAVIASVEPPGSAKPVPPAPAVAPEAATAPAVPDKAVAEKQDKHPKQDKQASTSPPPEPGAPVKSASAQQSTSMQPSDSLMVPKSIMAPSDPAAGKLIKPAVPPKTVTSAPTPEIAAVVPKASEEKASAETASEQKASEEAEPDSPPELVARRTEFGVDIGGANSVPGLRALWRGLLKSRANAALATLRPIIVIKENNNGLGMQLRLVAGPINDAAAAAKICAALTVRDRGCSTTVFEGQRLTMGADDQPKANPQTASEIKAAPEAETKPASAPKYYGHRHYVPKRQAKEDDPPPPPKEEPSTLSLIFGSH